MLRTSGTCLDKPVNAAWRTCSVPYWAIVGIMWFAMVAFLERIAVHVSSGVPGRAQPVAAPLGVQLYSVRDDIGPDDLTGRWTGSPPWASPTSSRSHPDEADQLAAAWPGTALRRGRARQRRDGEREAYLAARDLGLKALIVPWTDPRAARPDGVAALAAAINEAARRAADHGISVGYHNHDFEFRQQSGRGGRLRDPAGHAGRGRVPRGGHVLGRLGGADVFELVPRLGDRIRFLHVTNEPPDDDDPPILGVDITGRMDEVVGAGTSLGAMPVVEVVVTRGRHLPSAGAQRGVLPASQVRA